MTGGALSGDSTNGQALYAAGEKNAKLSGGMIDGGGDDKLPLRQEPARSASCWRRAATIKGHIGLTEWQKRSRTFPATPFPASTSSTTAPWRSTPRTAARPRADCDTLTEALDGAKSESLCGKESGAPDEERKNVHQYRFRRLHPRFAGVTPGRASQESVPRR